MFNTISARIGAACYVLWGLLHYGVAYNVYQSALGLPPSMAQGRLFQNAFYLFSFATAGIVIAVVSIGITAAPDFGRMRCSSASPTFRSSSSSLFRATCHSCSGPWDRTSGLLGCSLRDSVKHHAVR